MIPLVGFLPASDPRVQGTVAAIERQSWSSMGSCGTIAPSRKSTACRRAKGFFCPARFGWSITSWHWVVATKPNSSSPASEAGLANGVGLLSEEYEPHAGRLVGNFPQAFTHVALVNSAFNLWNPHGPAEHRAAKNGG